MHKPESSPARPTLLQVSRCTGLAPVFSSESSDIHTALCEPADLQIPIPTSPLGAFFMRLKMSNSKKQLAIVLAEKVHDLIVDWVVAGEIYDELRRLAAIEIERDALRFRLDGAVKAAEAVFGQKAIRYKFSLDEDGRPYTSLPPEMDGRWYALQPAEDDAHIGLCDEIASLRSKIEAARGKVDAEKLPEGKWSLGHRDGNWREIDHADHQAMMRIVWRMEDDDGPNHFLESQARAVVAALNDATGLP